MPTFTYQVNTRYIHSLALYAHATLYVCWQNLLVGYSEPNLHYVNLLWTC